MADIVSLWKAPQPGTWQRLLKSGFSSEDYPGFPGEAPDGCAYFALHLDLAKEYAACYGGGMIEVQLQRGDYEREFGKFEAPYQATAYIQLAIPNAMLERLNAVTLTRAYHA